MTQPASSSAGATQKNPNPQGKGLVPFLQDWEKIQTDLAGPDSASDFLRDYAISSLVLAAEFRFKPVPGKPYYLYSTASGWKLSLIAPGELGQLDMGSFLARCQLGTDMTWDLVVEDIDRDSPAARRAQRFILGFLRALNEQPSIAEGLPTYVAQLPYYRRLLATGLSSQLSSSAVRLGGEVKQLVASEQATLRLME
ncbi:MAG: hypothetical protein Hals2KO_31300 [Halioglobus sp.]